MAMHVTENRNGGGCALFVKNKCPSKRRTDLETESLEMMCVEICPKKAKNTICAVMYKPPSRNPDKFISGLEQEILERLSDEVQKDLVFMGDFNANVISPNRVNTPGSYCKQHDCMVLLMASSIKIFFLLYYYYYYYY